MRNPDVGIVVLAQDLDLSGADEDTQAAEELEKKAEADAKLAEEEKAKKDAEEKAGIPY